MNLSRVIFWDTHYRKTIAAPTLGILKNITAISELSGFNLAGGTSLALQIGHRLSVDLPDIAAMKLAAIAGRGRKKDFIDIYFLLKKYSLAQLFEFYNAEYEDGSIFMVSRSITYFEHWEQEEKNWEALIIKRGTRISPVQQERYKRIKAIASELGDFLDFLSDINTKTRVELSKNNFEEIKKAIVAKAND